jgi:hypothetical protein
MNRGAVMTQQEPCAPVAEAIGTKPPGGLEDFPIPDPRFDRTLADLDGLESHRSASRRESWNVEALSCHR